LSLFIGFTTYMLMPTPLLFYWCKMDTVHKITDTLEWIWCLQQWSKKKNGI